MPIPRRLQGLFRLSGVSPRGDFYRSRFWNFAAQVLDAVLQSLARVISHHYHTLRLKNSEEGVISATIWPYSMSAARAFELEFQELSLPLWKGLLNDDHLGVRVFAAETLSVLKEPSAKTDDENLMEIKNIVV